MNEILEKEWQRISSIQQLVEGKAIWTEEQVKELCNHFYNLALEDVRKEVENRIALTKNYLLNDKVSLQGIINFLDQLNR